MHKLNKKSQLFPFYFIFSFFPHFPHNRKRARMCYFLARLLFSRYDSALNYTFSNPCTAISVKACFISSSVGGLGMSQSTASV